ncbi:dihydrolipoamide acetyltransferase family protein [Oceanobacillus timonensis]|uniref:dihydrolipoamide acetyltransferase family protein n=1 Tax=Oceanobacillus timonensis TaxID=1926285 RepID=UPI0009BB2BAE|nr:dihydrolipoamide acetyltransferase family protein [Oceanobacillus timonensis]
MSENIVMPKLGMTMKQGTIEEWHKQVGDTVEEGESLATISSEKLTQDIEALSGGELLEIKIEAGGTAKVGDVLGILGSPGEKTSKEDDSSQGEADQNESETAVNEQKQAKEQTTAVSRDHSTKQDSGERIFISPLARKLAKEHDLPIEQINGTGGNGRITRLDINRVLEHGLDEAGEIQYSSDEAAVTLEQEAIGEGLDSMRKAIAQNMRQSLQQTAQLTLHRKANADKLIAFQKTLRNEAEAADRHVKLSLTALIARAVVLALKDYQKMNARYDNQELSEFDEVHLGIATSLDNGLVVPVVKNAEQKTIGSLAKDIRDVSTKARDGEADESILSGSTFTITNMGGSGVEYFTPILNLHEAGILGVGALQDELALENGEVIQIQKLPFSLTFDHQILDGADAGEFFSILVNYIENPYLLVL